MGIWCSGVSEGRTLAVGWRVFSDQCRRGLEWMNECSVSAAGTNIAASEWEKTRSKLKEPVSKLNQLALKAKRASFEANANLEWKTKFSLDFQDGFKEKNGRRFAGSVQLKLWQTVFSVFRVPEAGRWQVDPAWFGWEANEFRTLDSEVSLLMRPAGHSLSTFHHSQWSELRFQLLELWVSAAS